MNKYHINAGKPGERLIEADEFQISGEYFWFYANNGSIKAITKTKYVDTIDVI
jgi:hypothetical protein